MRVKDVHQISTEVQKSIIVDDKKSGGRATMDFNRRLTTLSNENYEKYIHDLTSKINVQGEVIAKKVDINEYQKYRELITQLLNETVSNSYIFSKTNQFDSRGRHKVFALIRKVNQKLDELAAEVLKEQSDNIKRLNILDDIRGLLMDLYL